MYTLLKTNRKGTGTKLFLPNCK